MTEESTTTMQGLHKNDSAILSSAAAVEETTGANSTLSECAELFIFKECGNLIDLFSDSTMEDASAEFLSKILMFGGAEMSY